MYVFLSSTISYILTKENMVSLPKLTVYLLLFIWSTKKQKKNATDQNLGIAQGQLLTCALILSRLASFGCKVSPSMFSLICCSPSRASELHSPGLPWAKALVSFSRSFLSKGNQTQSPEEEIKQELLFYSFFGIVLTEGSVSITYSPDALLPA